MIPANLQLVNTALGAWQRSLASFGFPLKQTDLKSNITKGLNSKTFLYCTDGHNQRNMMTKTRSLLPVFKFKTKTVRNKAGEVKL